MTQTDHDISVILPVYNSAPFLTDALASIAAQTRPPREIIVVDGPSTDATPDIARAFPNVRYLKQSGAGMWNAVNEGLAAACTGYISILSDDDLWHPEKLRLQAEWLDAHPDALVVFAHIRFELMPGAQIPNSFKPELLGGAYPGYMNEALMARRALFDKLGEFSQDYKISSDVDWYARLFEAQIAAPVLPEVLLTKRIHANNLSGADSSAETYNRELLGILRKTILRKRERAAS